MSSRNNGQNLVPIRISIPSYPIAPGRDLPTAGLLPVMTDHDHIFAGAWAPDAQMTQNGLDHDADLAFVPHVPAATCYRNASLAALFNLAPFINFLDRVNKQRRLEPNLYQQLAKLHSSFRNLDNFDDARERQLHYNQRVATFWQMLNQDPTILNYDHDGSNRSWRAYHQNIGVGSRTPGGQNERGVQDSNEFIIYLLERLIFGELDGRMVDSDTSM